MTQVPLDHDKIRGVFSSQEIRKVGTGTTTRKTVQKTFWYAEEDEKGDIFLQAINANFIPTGNKRKITRTELIEKYSPELEFYVQTVYPKMREINEGLDRADNMREKGETFSAEYEYDNVLAVDVENVRANFGIGLTYLQRGESDKAENIFGRLVKLDAAFEAEHKHLFNEFGINLRKNKMLDQALEYYQRGLELCKEDENLHINIARVYLEKNDIENCLKYVTSAYNMAIPSVVVKKFLEWLEAKKLITHEQAEAVRAGASSAQAENTPVAPENEPA